MVYVIILSVIAGALGLYYYLYKDLNVFKKHNIPHLKPLPLVGNMGPSILRKQSITELLKKIYDMYPEAKYVGVYELTNPIIMLRDIELIKSIGLKHFDNFMDHRSLVTKDQDPLFSRSLASLCGDKWREMRAVLSPSFTSSKMKVMFKLVSDCAVNFANFVAQLPPEEKIIQTKEFIMRYTSDVIATCAFGVSVDSMRDPKNLFYVYSKEAAVFDGMAFLKFYIFQKLPWLARMLKLRFVKQKIAEFFHNLVETTIKTRDEKGIVRPDMLQLMIESRNKMDGRNYLTIEDMTSQAFSFFLGGYETTSTLVCFAMHEIAINEDIQRRLQNEIDQVLEDTNGQVTYEAINNMEYLDSVLSETLRMYPAGIATDRVCVKDFELPPTLPGVKPYTIKKGQCISIPIHGLHYDPKYFNQPEKFDPERFLGEQKKHILNTGAYLPFGLGPRMCIASRFALMEMKVLLLHLLARCDLLPCEKTPIPLKLDKAGFILKPEGGFWLKAVPRKDPHRTVAVDNVNGAHDL
ncbi:cytochrome P450 9e2-like [Odontomachus brunneus]|uniref:cytochrome P450 9e2-like n=1 Tax=Odontomachus brunneus TaxID=486640 RepID=UPI0013F1BF8F|nr:cytochrome P450 9e2-like [Odontomachus brunneus]